MVSPPSHPPTLSAFLVIPDDVDEIENTYRFPAYPHPKNVCVTSTAQSYGAVISIEFASDAEKNCDVLPFNKEGADLTIIGRLRPVCQVTPLPNTPGASDGSED